MTDTTVYRRFLEGDPTAFEEIVSTYRIPLTGFILSIVRNENTAEDIAAEVFAHLFLKILYLLYWEECSYEEISKILIKSKKQIANLAFRGKQALKKEMEREGFEYAG